MQRIMEQNFKKINCLKKTFGETVSKRSKNK